MIGAFSACSGFLDVNEDPNNATEAPINGLLASSSLSTGLNYFRVSNSFTAFFVQYLASPNEGTTTDILLEADYSSAWGNLYGTMTDIYDMIQIGQETNALQHVGVGKILMAMNLGLVIDNWGDAPYSAAFTGEVVTPMYDTGEDLFATILRLLDEAEADLVDSANEKNLDSDSDFIHSGDINAWTRTAAAIRARYLNHLSKTSDYDPSAVLSAVDDAYQSNDQDAQVTRFLVRNPWAQVAVNNENLLLAGWLSEQFVDALNGTTYTVVDPRLEMLTDTTINGDYVGTENGRGRIGDGTEITESYLESDKAFSSPESPLILASYAEMKFIEAEAALRANNTGRALTAFQAGVNASMQKIGVSQLDADAYLAAAYPGLDAASLTLDNIFREKYVALFLQPETWVDARRYDYGYTDFSLPVNSALPTFIRRVQYPSTETDRNVDNVPIVTDLSSRLFWDQ